MTEYIQSGFGFEASGRREETSWARMMTPHAGADRGCVNRGQPFVIAGYTLAARTFDALVFGYYDGGKLIHAGRTRSGFTPASRDQLFKHFGSLAEEECPFANLPEARGGRWGEGLTAAKMKECRWLKPLLVGQFEFVEWTPDGHLRHVRFMGLCEGQEPQEVKRKT